MDTSFNWICRAAPAVWCACWAQCTYGLPSHHTIIKWVNGKLSVFAPGKSARIQLKTIQIDCHYWSNPMRHTNRTRFHRQILPSNFWHTSTNVCLYFLFSLRSKHFLFYFVQNRTRKLVKERPNGVCRVWASRNARWSGRCSTRRTLQLYDLRKRNSNPNVVHKSALSTFLILLQRVPIKIDLRLN